MLNRVLSIVHLNRKEPQKRPQTEHNLIKFVYANEEDEEHDLYIRISNHTAYNSATLVGVSPRNIESETIVSEILLLGCLV